MRFLKMLFGAILIVAAIGGLVSGEFKNALILGIVGLVFYSWGLERNPIPAKHAPEVNRSLQIVNDSIELINSSKNWSTKSSRIDLIVKIYEDLIKRFGRYREAEDFRKSLELAKQEQAVIHVQAVKEPVRECLKKAEDATTATQKVNACTKALSIIEKAKEDPLAGPEMLDSLRETVLLARSQFQQDGHLKKAEKHEFKGQQGKALDAYQEALWHLLNDDIDDAKQEESIKLLQAKINELKK